MSNKKVYLTFDMDWVIDEVLEEFNNLVGTIHVTHETTMLSICNFNCTLWGFTQVSGKRYTQLGNSQWREKLYNFDSLYDTG